jgi:mannose-6-phosphate isomerase-like protein (cupin superfamily)
MHMRKYLIVAACSLLSAADRKVDPTFLHRYVPEVREASVELVSPSSRYRPLFGAGDAPTPVVRGVARFGELTVDPGGSTRQVEYPAEEQAWVVLSGAGSITYEGEKFPVRKNDFFYLPPKVPHMLSCATAGPCRVVIMGFKIPAGTETRAPKKLDVANIDDVKLQTVGNHPDSVQYRLMMGDTESKRDRIAAARVLTSLYVMEFEPGGTNFPHHHETEEEIYLVLSGHGEMVADGGMDGLEGRHPAKTGDAYFYRLNCTVGFYASQDANDKARILAVRSRFPFRK